MKTSTTILFSTLLLLSFIRCTPPEEQQVVEISEEEKGLLYIDSLIQLDKWSPDDYESVLYNIRMNSEEDEYPRFDGTKMSGIIEKLVDTDNYKHILHDSTLGLTYRDEVSDRFFDYMNEMVELYSFRDKQDKFIYDQEFAAIQVFGLEFCIDYVKIGNENARANSDDPNSEEFQNLVTINENVAIENYSIYLDYINTERSFGDAALDIYTKGITEHFPNLIRSFPNGNYAGLKKKAILMERKAENPVLKSALTELISRLK